MCRATKGEFVPGKLPIATFSFRAACLSIALVSTLLLIAKSFFTFPTALCQALIALPGTPLLPTINTFGLLFLESVSNCLNSDRSLRLAFVL